MRSMGTSKSAMMAGAVVMAGLIGTLQTYAAGSPLVATVKATNVTSASATLRGTVNPNGVATTAWFEWGAGSAFSSATARTNLNSGSSPLNVGNSISGLTPGVIYHYRVAASNQFGVVRSPAVQFGHPTLTVLGANPMANPLNTNFVDPGVIVTSTPVALVAGYHQNVLLKSDGHAVAWGLDDNGQSTVPTDLTNAVAIAAGDLHGLALRANGSVIGWGYTNDGAIHIPSGANNNVIAVAAGGYHSLALKSDGSVLGWGGDWDGQSTVPADATNIIALAAGNSHSLALKADGTIVGWGNPWAWQGLTNVVDENDETITNSIPSGLVPQGLTNIVAIAAGGDHCLALRSDGTIYAWGLDSGADTTPEGATNLVAIAAGYRHNLALKADGSILAWGGNDFGQCDVPPEATNLIAIDGSVFHSVGVRADGNVVYWGIADSNLRDTPPDLNLPTNLVINVSGSVLTNVVGTYTLTYRTTNSLGFSSAASRNVLIGDAVPSISTKNLLGNGSFQIGVDFVAGKTFTVLATTNVALPYNNWTILGTAVESPAGHYEFIDLGAANFPQRYYRLQMAVP